VTRKDGVSFPPDSPLVVAVLGQPPSKRHVDADNLLASLKPAIDGIAMAVRVDDRRWSFASIKIGEPVKGGQVVIILAPIDPEAMAMAT
jgi:hypothetical protein